MRGLMQDVPLTLHLVRERAEDLFAGKCVTTATGDGHATITYGALLERVERLAAALADLGVGPGDRVATFAWNSQRHLELYLAVPCMGAVLHTLNPRLHPAQVAWIADHAEDVVVAVDASLGPAWEQVMAQDGDRTVRATLWMDDLDGQSAPDGFVDYEGAVSAAATGFDWPSIDEGSAAAMCYTSGTTGDPKGVVFSHRSSMLHAMASLFAEGLALTERDVVLPIVPQFHANAWGIPYAALMAGTNLAMPGRFMADPARVAELCAEAGVTVSAAVPTVWFGVLQAIRAGQVDAAKLTTLSRIVVGGSAMPEALMDGFDELGITMIHAWGMTETSPLGTVATIRSEVPDDEVRRVRLTQGLPAPTLKVRLVTDDGEVAPHDGETMGELQISGPWIADAYYDPSAPDHKGGHDRFDTGDGRRWLRTGDVAVIDPLGYVKLVDRTKDLVKSGGEWISTVELENHLMAHPGVAEAAVIAVPHEKWDERPLACVVKADESLTAEDLQAHLGERVASWQVPDVITFIDEVPKTSVGKFDKKVLRNRFPTMPE